MIDLKAVIKRKERLHQGWRTTKHILEEIYQIVATEVEEANIEEVSEILLELMDIIKALLEMLQAQQEGIKHLL